MKSEDSMSPFRITNNVILNPALLEAVCSASEQPVTVLDIFNRFGTHVITEIVWGSASILQVGGSGELSSIDWKVVVSRARPIYNVVRDALIYSDDQERRCRSYMKGKRLDASSSAHERSWTLLWRGFNDYVEGVRSKSPNINGQLVSPFDIRNSEL